MSRQAAGRRLEQAVTTVGDQTMTLAELAAAERARAGVPGPRTAEAAIAGAKQDREAILRALSETDSDEAARRRLGMARRSFYRKKAALGIDADAIAAARAARQGAASASA